VQPRVAEVGNVNPTGQPNCSGFLLEWGRGETHSSGEEMEGVLSEGRAGAGRDERLAPARI
jgi:hypothetical protein